VPVRHKGDDTTFYLTYEKNPVSKSGRVNTQRHAEFSKLDVESK
jgi:hypothetical protein